MGKKIFFFDIDGTLAVKNIIPEDTKTSLKKLQDLGHYVFICTGRPYIYAKYHFENYVDGFICANGRYIVFKDKILLNKPLTSKQIKYFIEGFDKLNCGYSFNGIDLGFAKGIKADKLDEMQKDFEHQYYIEEFQPDDVYAHIFDVHFTNNLHYQKIINHFKDVVVFNEHFNHNSADATIIGFDKGVAIKKLLTLLKITKENSFAFGDGFNDVCMFGVVGHSIAMKNGVEAAKKASEYITTDIFDGGIYNALCHYKIID